MVELGQIEGVLRGLSGKDERLVLVRVDVEIELGADHRLAVVEQDLMGVDRSVGAVGELDLSAPGELGSPGASLDEAIAQPLCALSWGLLGRRQDWRGLGARDELGRFDQTDARASDYILEIKAGLGIGN